MTRIIVDIQTAHKKLKNLLVQIVARKNILALEQQHAQGYEKHPMKDSELEEWESEQVWEEK